jgi:hypothetical protein
LLDQLALFWADGLGDLDAHVHLRERGTSTQICPIAKQQGTQPSYNVCRSELMRCWGPYHVRCK